ncbi:MAG: DUF962 domain-containing protein [Chitinophagales bacterium]|nr:DUF962 domain-containing protein [Chitinophagales bacterium]
MKDIQSLLDEYGISHQNATNKLIHWICIPIIVFSLLGMLWSIPLPINVPSVWINLASIVVLLALIFYMRLSLPIALGFVFIGGACLYGNYVLATSLPSGMLWKVSVALFVIAWIGQFIGHKIEGKKPSFFKDLQFLLIGPAWLLHFIMKKMGISYK